ncbi:glutamate receptor 2.8-like [Triticum aestivum]|uniref:glutamate receptor 2.8-like n=1 Tax=Triticum aestivum TaxID=4565 RepID=UPI001D0103AB|nr:glutamate receptor 2.8-like [Triticum aestivum]
MWSSGCGSDSRSGGGSDPERERRVRSDGARKCGARRWTNRGMSPPESFWRSETEEYDRRRASFSSARSSYAGSSSSSEIERRNTRILSRRDASGGSTRGYSKKLKIAVPYKPGFNVFVNATTEKVTGYCIDVFEAAAKNLPHVLDYHFVVVDGLYDQLVRNVSSGIFDAAVGDITITAERAVHVDFTMPYIESGVSLLVLNEDDSKPTIEWVFLKPLTMELWLAIVGGFFLTGIVVWMIERPKNLEYQGSSSRQFSTALYFSFSTLTFSHG